MTAYPGGPGGPGGPDDPVLSSFLREDLRSVPGPALAAALAALERDPGSPRHHLDACLAALAAGEPKRARWHLEQAPQPPRLATAARAWAIQLDGNWYPGGVGAETEVDLEHAFVQPTPGDFGTELLEHVVAYGPTGLTTPRTLLEMSLRNGARPGVHQALVAGSTQLDALTRFAIHYAIPDLGHWAALAGADLAHRAGVPTAEAMLANARAQLAQHGDTAALALSHLLEGDWYAAPGASPESLGLDLAPQQSPSPWLPADPVRASACYDAAGGLLAAADARALPRMRAALSLRHAYLAGLAGDRETRARALDDAEQLSGGSGDGATVQLVRMHRLVADIEEGRLGQHALDLGSGWHRPGHGPVADLLDWTASVGSRSWCVGLGRLLERCAGRWNAAGSLTRARIGYLAALQLVSVDARVPAQTLVTAVAYADARSNLSTNALIRLERAFGPVFADTSVVEPFAFAQKLEASLVMVSTLQERARGPAAGTVADRLDVLRAQLAEGTAQMRAAVPPVDVPVPTSMEALVATVQRMRGDGTLETQAGMSGDALVLMQHMQLAASQHNIDMIDVVIPLTRGEDAQRCGRPEEADVWFDRAVEAARRPGVAPHLLPVALLTARRLPEAREVLIEAEATETLSDAMLVALYLRAEEHARAGAALERMHAVGQGAHGWRDLQTRAELELALGRHEDARASAGAAIAAFEDAARLLLRDPERLEACDQPDVAAMYATLAKCHLAPSVEAGPPQRDASFEAAERARSLTHDAELDRSDTALRQAWQRSAAEYAAIANRVAARLPWETPEKATRSCAALDAADGVLAEAERALDAAEAGVLLRRADAGSPTSAAELRRRLPEGTLLLEYLAVGEDLLAWAMSRDTLRPLTQRISSRDLTATVRSLHSGCAHGRAPGTVLETLLLEPFVDLLRAHPRVVVVPFGPLMLVPFHVLQLDGRPLGLSHVVSYALRASSLLEDPDDPGGAVVLDRPATARRPLVVGDPEFDPEVHPGLEPLPGSRTEAQAVGAALGASGEDVLVGAAATEAEVADRLETSDLVHLSTHGHLDVLSPFASSLVLAGPDELTVADIAGLRSGTDLAVLSGCDTGRGTATLGGDLVGLTRSLLRSGVRRTVVSMWPVDDEVAPVTMHRFHTALAAGLPPAQALAEAQRAVFAMSLAELQAAYVELGGVPDADDGTRRRGVELDPELRDEEEVPDPLDGDAERFWAPFVLVD